MDRITSSLLSGFAAEQGYELLSESDQFERFCNYLSVSKEYSQTFDVDDVSCKGGQDTGIDGIAIIVNGVLVTSPDAVQDLAETNKYLEASFVFIQAKTSASFEGADILNFTSGVRDFFADKPSRLRNEFVQNMAEVKDEIFNQIGLFRGKPTCKLFYATTGVWTDDKNLSGRIDAEVKLLEGKRLFSKVTFEPIDADSIQKLNTNAKSEASVDFMFQKHTALPMIEGVSEAYIGVMPAKEYIKLIVDDSGNIRKSLFYDNIRDFQDWNEVNQDIRTTLQSGAPDRFAILNNGVTIVAREVKGSGDVFHIRDYQIVNGCQTSHVLFHERLLLRDDVFLTVKIICTADDGITSEIIKATNFQTEVTAEQLSAFSEFQKKLEQYYLSFRKDPRVRLYYERRSKQYASDVGIEKNRIVTIPNQIKVYSSIFLRRPHQAGRYYSSLFKAVKNDIFLPGHCPDPYFISALASFKLETLFRNGKLNSHYKKFHHHLLRIFALQSAGQIPDPSHHRKTGKYCEGLLQVLSDDIQALASFERTTKIIDKVWSDGDDRAVIKKESFTDRVERELNLSKLPTG